MQIARSTMMQHSAQQCALACGDYDFDVDLDLECVDGKANWNAPCSKDWQDLVDEQIVVALDHCEDADAGTFTAGSTQVPVSSASLATAPLSAATKSYGQFTIDQAPLDASGPNALDNNCGVVQKAKSLTSFAKRFTEPPPNHGLAVDACFFYIGCVLNGVVAVVAFVDNKWRLCIINTIAVIAPGIVHAANVYFALSIVKKDMPASEKGKEAIWCILNLTRFKTAYRYWHGATPMWSVLFKERLVYLTTAVIPAVTANIMDLLNGSVQENAELLLMGITMFNLIKASWTMKLVHTCGGPPSNMQKYRFWDVEKRPFSNVFFVVLIDFSQVYYRVVMFALVASFASVSHALALMIGMLVATALFARLGFQYIQSYEVFEPIPVASIMAIITGLETAAYDYCWLEPVPVYSFYVESIFALRTLQALIGAWMIAIHWEKHAMWNQHHFNVFFCSGVFFASIYFTAYPYYVYYVSKDRVLMAFEKRDEFIGNQMKGKSERRQAKRAVIGR